MTRTRWEYLSLTMVGYAETKSSAPGQMTYEYQYKWWVTRPGVAADKAEELHHALYAEFDRQFDSLAYMNQLGQEGWELVSDTIVKSGVNTRYVGWGTTSEPVHRTFLFKRSIE